MFYVDIKRVGNGMSINGFYWYTTQTLNLDEKVFTWCDLTVLLQKQRITFNTNMLSLLFLINDFFYQLFTKSYQA